MKRLIFFLTLFCGGIFAPSSLCAASESKDGNEFSLHSRRLPHVVKPPQRLAPIAQVSLMPRPTTKALFEGLLSGYMRDAMAQGLGEVFSGRSIICSTDARFAASSRNEQVLQDPGTQFVVYNRGKSSNGSDKEVFHWFLHKDDVCYAYNTEDAEWRTVGLKQAPSGDWVFDLSVLPLSEEEKKQHKLPDCRFDTETTMIGGGAAASKNVKATKVEFDPITGLVQSVTRITTGKADGDRLSDPDNLPEKATAVAGKDLVKNEKLVAELKKRFPQEASKIDATVSHFKKIEQKSTITASSFIINPQSIIVALAVASCIGASEYSQAKNHSVWVRSAEKTRLAHLKMSIQSKLPDWIKKSSLAQKALALSAALFATCGVKKLSGVSVMQPCKDDVSYVPDITNISLLTLNGYIFYACARYLLTPDSIEPAFNVIHEKDKINEELCQLNHVPQ